MNAVWLIAGDTIRSLLHRRLLLGLMLASLALTVAFSVGFSKVRSSIEQGFGEQAESSTASDSAKSGAQRRKLNQEIEGVSFAFQGFFYMIASFGGSLVALFIFSTAVSSEIRSGTIRLTLAKPVSRTQFLLGKFAGGVAVMAAYSALASAAIVAFTHSHDLELTPAMTYAPWLMFCQQLMMGSVALLLALFVHPVVAAAVAFFAGNGLYSPPNPLYYMLPSYGAFDLNAEMFAGTIVGATDVGWLTLYAVDFVALMLLLALWRFRTEELV